MSETPVFFENGAYALFGVLHEPETATGAPFVFCHPFGEEKLWSHRVFVSFARRLAAAGHPVLRFDCMGNGDSDGEFSESSLETMRADLRRAVHEARRVSRAERVNLLGLRLGATVASLVAEELDDVDRLILWAPIVEGARYMQEVLRSNLSTQMAVYKEVRQDRAALAGSLEAGHAVNVDGYDLTFPLFSEVSAVRLTAAAKRHERPCLVVYADRLPDRLPAEMKDLAATYARGTLAAVQEEPFWKEIPRFYDRADNLFRVTTTWLQQ